MRQALHMLETLPPVFGDVMRNGAIVVDSKVASGGGTVVLCRWSGSAPWVTWIADEELHCHWGHYRRTLLEAAQDFERRS